MTTEQIYAELKEALQTSCQGELGPAGEGWLNDWIGKPGFDGTTSRAALVASDVTLLDDLREKILEIEGARVCEVADGKFPPTFPGEITVPALLMIEALLSYEQTKLCTKAAATA